MEKVVIIDALRTPIGKYRGSLSEFQAVDLGVIVTKELIHRHPTLTTKIDYVTFGNVLQAGQGQNLARQIALKSGLDVSIPAVTVNQVCGSGMNAVFSAVHMLRSGAAHVVLAGGTESMTNAPKILVNNKEAQDKPVSAMFIDGLTDAFSGAPMGGTAENLAEKFDISQTEQDLFALHSQQKAANARNHHWFDSETVPVNLIDRTPFLEDEGIRPETTLEKLATLQPAFKEQGSVTPGNCSTINDGAAALLLCTKSYALENNIDYLAEIEEIVEVGIEPDIMGISPINAIQKLQEKTQLDLNEVDLFEINEAFAVSSLIVEKTLQLEKDKVNIAGSGIALGHPLGATGARIIVTLIHQLQRTGKHLGIASLCSGGGVGLALLLRVPTQKKTKIPPRSFYKQSPTQRREQLVAQQLITEQQRALLTDQNLEETIANHLIENQISDFPLPLGLVPDVRVNGVTYAVPLVTEEPSVVAACSNGVKMARQLGGFQTTMETRLLMGQLVFSNVKNKELLLETLSNQETAFYQIAENAYPSIVQRGGGIRKIVTRSFAENETYVSVDVFLDPQEAMGANILNTVLETMAHEVKKWTDEEVLVSILSNYATEALVRATCKVPFTALSKTGNGQTIATKIQEISLLAQLDPYRAVTHNKGIMNGIEAFTLALGNDTRAVEAAAHAYASRSGQYRGLSQWHVEKECLVGHLEMPLLLASVGGATAVLPKAEIVHSILGNPEATTLAKIGGSIGLAQNLAALRALVSEGIQKGHMSLHARALAMSVGAKEQEIQQVAQLLQSGTMNKQAAADYLQQIRQ